MKSGRQHPREHTHRRILPRLLILPTVFSVLVTFSCRDEVPAYPPEDRQSLSEYLDRSRTSPGSAVAALLSENRRLIFAQDNVLRADTVAMMKALLPVLGQSGVAELGVYFLDVSSQAEIDGYLAGRSVETDAVDLLFAGRADLGYREYSDFIMYVRDYNAADDRMDHRIRLTALSMNGQVDADRLRTFLNPPDGNSEVPIAAWLRISDLADDGMFPDDGTKPDVAVHHGPDQDGFRWGGLIEDVGRERDIRDRTFAFRAEEAPFDVWDGMESGISADLYLVTSFPYAGVNPIPDFITSENVQSARPFFPSVRWEHVDWIASSRMNRHIRIAARRYIRSIDRLNGGNQDGTS